jgi:thioredoxin reductase (NADPH)
MAALSSPIMEARRDQMFPKLTATEIEHLRRFGEVRSYSARDYLSRAGEVAAGMFVILSGEVLSSQHDALGRQETIATHGPGNFTAELATLSGRPSLADNVAQTAVKAIVVPPSKLREVMVAEAELGERIMRAFILRRVVLIQSGFGGPVVLGHASDRDVLRLSNFLARNGYPYKNLDPDTDENAKALVERFHVDPSQLPIVLCPNGQMLRNPAESELAHCLGTIRPVDPGKIYDVAIVGAGPAGLAAAVYGASEGLSVIVLDSRAFGGQAGASARIENYLGFPTGISGLSLMARAFNQAQKFGVDMSIPDEALRLRDDTSARSAFLLDTSDGEAIRASAVVVASGARYRRLDIANLDEFEGSHVHYWASPLEARLCANQEVALVGAGNSAGQAAVYLASHVAKVSMLVRGASLEATMSHYLVERINAQPNIEILVDSEISKLEGEPGALTAIRWRRRSTGEETRRPIRHVFLFIGAEPNTDWLKSCRVEVDAKGFVCTSAELGRAASLLETSRPGIFAIGDVRSGSVKRVASAVGEGAQVVAAIHAYLADMRHAIAGATP